MTANLETGTKPPAARTELGNYIEALMSLRGLRSRAELVRIFEEHGYEVSENTLYNYIAGRVLVPPKFGLRLIKALSLKKEEQKMLAWLFLTGQGED